MRIELRTPNGAFEADDLTDDGQIIGHYIDAGERIVVEIEGTSERADLSQMALQVLRYEGDDPSKEIALR